MVRTKRGWRLADVSQTNKNIVISDTNLNTKYRNILIENLKELGYDVEIKEFDISWKEACRRDSLRKNGVGADLGLNILCVGDQRNIF